MSTKLRQIITIEDSNLANATKKEYGYRLKQFFHDSTIKSYEELIDAPSEEIEDTLITYCKFLLTKVSEKSLSPNTIPKMFKPIKFVLDVNYRENDVRWRPIEALFPPTVRRSGYKAWTTEQIQEMLEHCTTSRNKSLIHFMASIGGRVGIHDHALLMKHLIPMSSQNNDNMDCYAVLLYAEEDESAEEKDIRDSSKDTVSGDSYWAFLTPEATKQLKRYHNERKRCNEIFTDDTPIFRNEYSSLRSNDSISQLTKQAIYNIFLRCLRQTSIRRTMKGRRNDIQLMHGFRKRFNTILKLENNVNANIAEKILGHKNGLDGVYFVPTRQQCFSEFLKAIPFLTISNEERLHLENEKLKEGQSQKDKKHQMQKMEEMELNILQLQNEVGILRKNKKSDDKVIRSANTILYKNQDKIPELSMKSVDPKYFVKDKDIEKNYNKIFEIDSHYFEADKQSQ